MGGRVRWGFSTVLFLGLSFVRADGAAGQTLEWGARLGFNVSAVLYADGGALNGVVPKPGLHLGAATAWEISQHATVEAAVVASQDGFRGEGAHPGDFRMDYVDVPVVGKLRLPTRVSPHLLAGFAVGYMVRCRLTGVAIVGDTTCDDRLVGTRWRSFDFGALGGIGVSLPTRRGRWEFDLFGSLGIRDLKVDLLPPGAARRVAARLSVTLFPTREDRS